MADDLRRVQPPADDPLYARFWEGTRNGLLLAQECSACGRLQWPPREECLGCGSAALGWTEMQHRGRVRTYVCVDRAFHPAFADDVPFVLVLVEVAPGVRFLGRLHGIAREQVGVEVIGLGVRPRFRSGECGDAVLVDWEQDPLC